MYGLFHLDGTQGVPLLSVHATFLVKAALCAYILNFIYSFLKRHLSCFYSVDTVNNAGI